MVILGVFWQILSVSDDVIQYYTLLDEKFRQLAHFQILSNPLGRKLLQAI